MEQIDINKIKGIWYESGENGFFSGGDDTINSIKLVAEKVNEIIEALNSLTTKDEEKTNF